MYKRARSVLTVVAGILALLFIYVNFQIVSVWRNYDDRLGVQSASRDWLNREMTSYTLATYDMLVTLRRLESICLQYSLGRLTRDQLNTNRRLTRSALEHFSEGGAIASWMDRFTSFNTARKDARAFLDSVEAFEHDSASIEDVTSRAQLSIASWSLLKVDSVMREFELRDEMKGTIAAFRPLVTNAFILVGAFSVLCALAFGLALYAGWRILTIERRHFHHFELLVASVGHDLRSPLQTIQSAGALLGGSLRPSERQHYSSVVKTATRTLARLVDDILRVVRQEPLSVEWQCIDIREWFAGFVYAHQPKASVKGLLFTSSCDVDAPFLLLDPDRLTQCVGNLVDNAIKFTGTGAVNVRVSFQPALLPAQSAALVICVQDTGKGIRSGDRSRVFEPFERGPSDDAQVGMGLGLSIAQRLAQSLGGTIDLKSTVGVGSTFRVVIPVRVASPELCADHEEEAQVSGFLGGPPTQEPEILVVDDDRTIRGLVARLLWEAGFSVETANSGEVALAMITASDYGLVLTDIQMPGIDGFELARRVRLLPRVPKLAAMTAYPERLQTDSRAKVFDFTLSKPFDEAELLDLIDQAMTGEPDHSNPL